jgi:hypothetical protein
MSSRTTSICTIIGADTERSTLYSTIVDDMGCLDFNYIVPMPASLQESDNEQQRQWMIKHWGAESNAFDHWVPYRAYNQKVDNFPVEMETFINIRRFEAAGESHDLSIEPIEFKTVNGFPAEIFFKLSEQNPALTFEVSFFDDQFSCRCGKYYLKGGEVIQSKVASYPLLMTKDQCHYWENYAQELAGLRPVA